MTLSYPSFLYIAAYSCCNSRSTLLVSGNLLSHNQPASQFCYQPSRRNHTRTSITSSKLAHLNPFWTEKGVRITKNHGDHQDTTTTIVLALESSIAFSTMQTICSDMLYPCVSSGSVEFALYP